MARRQIGHGGHARFACRATVAFPEPRRRRDRSLTSPCTSQSRPVDRPLPRATAPVGLHCQPSRLRSHPRPLRATPPRGRPEPRSRRRARAVNETIVAPMRPQGKIKLASTPIRLASPLIEVTRMGISSFQLPESRLTNRPPQYCPRTPVGGILHAKHALGDHVACNGLGRMEPMSGTARSAAARTTDLDGRIIKLSTEDIPEQDRVASWREHHSRVMLRADIEPARDAPFSAVRTARYERAKPSSSPGPRQRTQPPDKLCELPAALRRRPRPATA